MAIKVIRANSDFKKHAQLEIAHLKMLDDHVPLPSDRDRIVQMRGAFMHGDHQCLVFDLLGPTLFDLLLKNPNGTSPLVAGWRTNNVPTRNGPILPFVLFILFIR